MSRRKQAKPRSLKGKKGFLFIPWFRVVLSEIRPWDNSTDKAVIICGSLGRTSIEFLSNVISLRGVSIALVLCTSILHF